MKKEQDLESVKSLGQIIATPGLLKGPPTTAPENPASSVNLKKRSDWLAKWMRLEPTHYQLKVAMVQIYNICSEYAKSPARGKTIVIFGENGSGKSHIAKAVCQWANAVKMRIPLVIDHSENGTVSTASARFVNWAEVVDGFKPPRCDYQIIEDLQNCTMLVIDDLGAEHDPSQIGVEKLYVTLNRREFNWNIITTNVLPAQWKEKFERRVSSRLFRNAQHIDLSQVPDYNA